jgi:hypothetical protein
MLSICVNDDLPENVERKKNKYTPDYEPVSFSATGCDYHSMHTLGEKKKQSEVRGTKLTKKRITDIWEGRY